MIGGGREIGGDAGRTKHMAAELDLEAGFGGAAADNAVGVDAVRKRAPLPAPRRPAAARYSSVKASSLWAPASRGDADARIRRMASRRTRPFGRRLGKRLELRLGFHDLFDDGEQVEGAACKAVDPRHRHHIAGATACNILRS